MEFAFEGLKKESNRIFLLNIYHMPHIVLRALDKFTYIIPIIIYSDVHFIDDPGQVQKQNHIYMDHCFCLFVYKDAKVMQWGKNSLFN